MLDLSNRLPFGCKLAKQSKVEVLYSFKASSPSGRFNLKQFNLVFAGATRIARTLNFADALDAFERDLQLYVAENSRRYVFIHSGVIALKGQAILIPGRSLSGKSTLVREFIKSGATYYSDEYALLDIKGRVHPYPLPIGLRTHPLEKQAKLSIETLGGTIGKKPLPVGLVLATEYKEGARWRPKQIPPGQGLLAMLANTVSAQNNPAKAIAALQQVVLKAPVLKGVRGETAEVVEALLNRPWPVM